MVGEDDDKGLTLLKPGQDEAKLPDWFNTNTSMVNHFCIQMKDCDNAPANFYTTVVDRLKNWNLIDETIPSTPKDIYEFSNILNLARTEAAKGSAKFNESFKNNPWKGVETVDASYSNSELKDTFPRGLELREILGEDTQFIYRKLPAEYPLKIVVRKDGKQQVLKVVDSDRTNIWYFAQIRSHQIR